MNRLNDNKYAGIGLVFGLMIGANIAFIGAGIGLVIGLVTGAAIDFKTRKCKK